MLRNGLERLGVEIKIELVWRRAAVHLVDLVFDFVVQPIFDHVGGEHIALEQEFVIVFQLTQWPAGARGDDAQSDEALLRAHLAKVHADGDVAMVVVDDAHCLPQICTEFLLGLAEERGRIELRLLLTTEPGRLGFSTNDSRHVHVVVLQPFDLQQTGVSEIVASRGAAKTA